MALTLEDISAAVESGLGAYGSLVAAWPGPAALFDGAGRPVADNAAGARLLVEFPVPVRKLVQAALLGSHPSSTPIGSGRIDLVAVPMEDGVLLLGRDMALATNLHKALAESRARYKDLVEISSDFAWETDGSGQFVFVSPQGALGYPADTLVGLQADSLLLDPAEEPTPFAARGAVSGIELWLRRADGEPACVVVSARPTLGGARGVWHDMTEERARDQALADARHREQRMAYVVRAIRDPVDPAAMLDAAVKAIARALDADGAAIWRLAGGTMTVATAQGAANVLGDDLAARAAADGGVVEGEAADHLLLVEATRFAGRVNGALGVVRHLERSGWTAEERSFARDLAAQLGIALAQVEAQEELARLADTDALTGLMNRRSFTAALGRRLHLAARSGQAGALAYIDLDNFKPINDRLGHPAGDAALRAVAQLLRAEARASDLVARLGGDEFALWLDNIGNGAGQRAARLVALKAQLGAVSVDPAVPLGLSVGMAIHDPRTPENLDALMARADAAMYQAKHAGKGRYHVAPPAEEQP